MNSPNIDTPYESAHAFKDDVLSNHDACGISELVRQNELSAVEVVNAAIDRSRSVDAQIHSVVTECFESAVSTAATPPDGVFQGVPTFIKDMNDVPGLPTRFGTTALANSPSATKLDPFVKHLLSTGLICLGKSTMSEFGFTPSTEFSNAEATRNPWNLAYSAGGSSGGAGALVAAGVVPIAHGADGGGSIRIPAATCGLVGLKSTRGRLPHSNNTRFQLANIVVEGVLTRSVRDTIRFYTAAEAIHRNPRLEPIGKIDQPIDCKLRIAAISTSHVDEDIDQVTRREFNRTIELLTSLGHDVEDASFPATDALVHAFSCYWTFLAFAMTKAGSKLIDSSFDANTVTGLTKHLANAFKSQWSQLPISVVRIRKSAKLAQHLFPKYDVVLTPTMGHTTPKIGHFATDVAPEELFDRAKRWARFTPFANATGLPSISLPLGHEEQANLPVGMMFTANHGAERTLLQLALQLESASPWRSLSET